MSDWGYLVARAPNNSSNHTLWIFVSPVVFFPFLYREMEMIVKDLQKSKRKKGMADITD